MPMTIKDFRQLEKMMQLTFSDNDAEALSALRMANAVLKRNGYIWTSAFKRLVKVEGSPLEAYVEEAPKDETLTQARRRRHREALASLESSRLTPSQEDFVASLQDWLKKKGFLTEAQGEALLRMERDFT